MAASTSINFTLQARDWEAVVGIINYNPLPDFQELLFALNTFVRNAVTKPSGATTVTITTTELMVTKIAEFMYGNTVRNIATDTGANAFTRVMAAVRAANNAADNYINTTLAALDATNTSTALAVRKSGRQVIMMAQYDGQ